MTAPGTMPPLEKPSTEPRHEAAALWWVGYGRSIADFATAVATRDRGRRLAARESLWQTISAWGGIVGHPLASALMADHAAFLLAFGDAAAAGDKAGMGALLGLAASNVEEQGRLYAADSTTFSEDRFREAFFRYTVRTAAYLSALMLGDRPEFEKAFAQTLGSRDEISKIWIESLSRK